MMIVFEISASPHLLVRLWLIDYIIKAQFF